MSPSIGRLRVERLLGTGSFATVWLARDPDLDAFVAVKVLAENWAHDPGVRERFLAEARLLRRLDDERVLRVHGVGETEGRPYAVLAYADRGSLKDRLGRGPVPREEAIALMREIAAGVAVLHRAGIVHRDLTPGNVLFQSRPDGSTRVLVADLGLAKDLAVASGFTAAAGTPGYMAPEQSDPLAIVDARTDVFALGRLAAELGVPVKDATAVKPADRPADAMAFAAALPRPAAPAVPAPPRLNRRRLLIAGGAAALLAAAGGATAWLLTRGGTATSGPLSVTVPEGWEAVTSTWSGHGDAPGILLSPTPDRWGERGVPGAFVGYASDLAATVPHDYVSGLRHDECGEPVTRTLGGWALAEYADCANGPAPLVEAAAPGLVYAQIAPPGDGFTDTFLRGITIG